ncbi:MFS transporter [Xylanimonas protaetiae]|uniref:MFS transporter n=1 Tax=Xylanimonas protaetiae TaxID=2509457 RepID=A0A4P6F089_9MICO|nr:MFS transporter [Xylanimonas protaetiae]QAY68834.1 MFS transporter [Xylanimonas protaetiae]
MAKNKYLNGVLPMALINFAIGSVYCWTLFKADIWAHTGFGPAVTSWSFSIAIFVLGMSAAFGGKLVEKNPRRSAFWTFVMVTLGWFVTGFGIQTRSALVTILGFGVIQGIGLGLGYITPVKTMMIWFDKRKGLAAGLSIAAFGVSGVLINPLVAFLLDRLAVYTAFYALAAIFGVGLFAAARLLWRPPASQEDMEAEKSVATATFSVRSVVLSKKFVFLWIVFFLNITGGLALISHEKQLYNAAGQTAMGMILLFVMVTAASNVIGRVALGAYQDRTANKHQPFYVMTIVSIAATAFAALFADSITVTFGLVIVIQFMFGVGFACIPNVLHQNWGISRLSTVHGLILSAWAAAGLVGNQISSFFLDGPGAQYLYLTLVVLYSLQLVALFVWVRVRTTDRVEAERAARREAALV